MMNEKSNFRTRMEISIGVKSPELQMPCEEKPCSVNTRGKIIYRRSETPTP